MVEQLAKTGDPWKDRDYINRRMSAMDVEYESFEGHYKQLTDFCSPRKGRYFIDDVNKGDRRHKEFYNNTALSSIRTAVAGVIAGAMSPSRPWFKFTLMDKVLLQQAGVKEWLALFQEICLLVFHSSNFYTKAPSMVEELLVFGTGCMMHVDDFEDVARFYAFTVGSYRIAQNDRQIVDTIGRRFMMTVEQVVSKFGYENCSTTVKNHYDRGNYDTWVKITHFIDPNPYHDPNSLLARNAMFREVYFETGQREKDFLRRTGHRVFPAYVPRFETTGEDIFGTNCPGMASLGDIKQLQSMEKTKAQAIQLNAKPPLQGPPSIRGQKVMNIPGGMTPLNIGVNNAKIESIYQVDPRVRELVQDIETMERRIARTFYVDLFLAITAMPGVQPRNELELTQVNQERLLQLGPALQRIHGEWLEKAVMRVALQVLNAGIMPQAPRDLQGRELELEFVSALAQAQKIVTTNAITSTVGFAGAMAEAGIDVRDKVNGDVAIEQYSDLVGAPPAIIVPTEEVERLRQERNQMQLQQAQMQMAQDAASVAKTAADSKLDDDNVLSRAAGG